MTFHQAKGLRPIRRSTLNRVSALGVALMLACAPALAAAPAEKPVGATVAPAAAPAGLSVAKIDFKRGDDGAGGRGDDRERRREDHAVGGTSVHGACAASRQAGRATRGGDESP